MTNITISEDSGAHTLYNIFFAGQAGVKGLASRLGSKYEYTKSPKFQRYLESYIEFLHETKDYFEFYVTLDIIFNPELSWEMQEYFVSCGLKPLPVFHYGEDFKWLHKYIEKYDYVGIGGLGQDISVAKYIAFGDKVFKTIKGQNNQPIVKTHGFAVNAVPLLKRYPWYSVDASSWTAFARNGVIIIPSPIWKKKKVLGFSHLKRPATIPVTDRSLHRIQHYLHQFKLSQQVIENYVASFGFTMEQTMEYWPRDILNLKFYKGVEKAIKVWHKENFNGWEGGNIYFAGQPSASVTIESLERIVKYFDDIKFLPSFFYKRHTQDLLELKYARQRKRFIRKENNENKRLVKSS